MFLVRYFWEVGYFEEVVTSPNTKISSQIKFFFTCILLKAYPISWIKRHSVMYGFPYDIKCSVLTQHLDQKPQRTISLPVSPSKSKRLPPTHLETGRIHSTTPRKGGWRPWPTSNLQRQTDAVKRSNGPDKESTKSPRIFR
jgi:hypothetical protein